MIPDGFEPLGLDENIIVARVNLCCAALGMFAFGVLAGPLEWPMRSIVFGASAGLILLARQLKPLARRFGAPRPGETERPIEYYWLHF